MPMLSELAAEAAGSTIGMLALYAACRELPPAMIHRHL
jgi:hypothetical protein